MLIKESLIPEVHSENTFIIKTTFNLSLVVNGWIEIFIADLVDLVFSLSYFNLSY